MFTCLKFGDLLCRLVGMLFVSAIFFVYAPAQTPPADTDAKILEAVEFSLSDEAAAAGIDGTLLLAVSIDKTGAVKTAKVIAGPAWPCSSSPKKQIESLRESVVDSIKLAKFSPAIKGGKPTDVEVGITVSIGRAYKDLVKRREMEDAKKDGSNLPVIIDSGVLTGKALSLPKPEYPYRARSSRASGAVTVGITIDEEGKVVLAGAQNGHPYLQDAARDAACKAKFAPTSLKGEPVKVSGVVTYNFVAP